MSRPQKALPLPRPATGPGVGTNLAVFDAVVALNQAKINSIKALYDYNTGKARLDKAIGIAAI
ncbi:hypothetical protein SPTER_10360 [Sporomusa termitida]|uniref:Uncharacterized protein n=1 Tax=Sporomusa termitida TaxID=2377 RepID=A0A517DQW6_9FIRM|nr:hypothetical protein SPTER_10360 [Sporomusa termitida]